MNRQDYLSLFAVLAIAALFGAALTLHAENQLLRGVITRDGATVEGAVVKIKDLATLQLRSYITGADGEYHFAGLRTNVDYEVWVVHKNYRSSHKTLSRFDSKPQSTLDLTLE